MRSSKVAIAGKRYPISAYPAEFIDWLERNEDYPTAFIRAEKIVPGDAPDTMIPDWKGATFLNGNPYARHSLGVASSVTLGFQQGKQVFSHFVWADDHSRDIVNWLEWLRRNCTTGYVVTRELFHSGDGVLLGGYEWFVSFMSDADEAAFLAHRKGARS